VGLTNKEVIKLNRRKTTMKLRNILITAAAVGFMFASANRTDVVGYTAGDYADMNTFAHKVAGQNVAWTAGDNFNAVWTDDGATWGFMGGNNQDLVNMWWSNGTYGLNVGLEMTPEYDTNGETAGLGTWGEAAATNFSVGFGMELMGMDLGFSMDMESSDMALNLRGGFGFWAFDTFTVGFNSYGEQDWTVDSNMDGYADGNAETVSGVVTKKEAYTVIDLGMYGTQDWGAATGMFGLGLSMDSRAKAYNDAIPEGFGVCPGDANLTQAACTTAGYTWDDTGEAAAVAAVSEPMDAATTINTNFSVESTLTDWCDLRVGYSKSFNMGDNSVSDNYGVGLGFNYGSVGLDMVLTDGVLGNMMSNPLSYVNGRNTDALTTSWTLTYTW